MLITNFASGELSPNLNGRVDLRQYYQGAARIENFEVIPTGGIKRRPGLKRVGELTGNSRIIPFIVDKNSVYILELYAEHIAVWKRGVLGNYSIIQTLETDYASLAEIKEIQYAQNYDTIVFVHRDYQPFILKVEAGVFSGSAMQFEFWPDVELDDDFDYVIIQTGPGLPEKETTDDGHGRFTYKRIEGETTKTYIKDYNAGITDFWCTKDGKLYKWDVSEWKQYGQDIEIDTELFTTENKYPSCVAFFNNRLYFASTTEKPQMVWASSAPDNYGTRYNNFATYKKFVTVNKVTKNADLHIFTCDLLQANIDTENHTTTFSNLSQNFTVDGTLEEDITSYFVTSDILPVGTKVIAVTSDTLTVDTDEVAVVFDEEEEDPAETNIVMSIQLWRTADALTAEDYTYMVVANNCTTADCSLFFELASDQNDAIKFLSSNRFLAVGTESSIWSIDPGINALSINAIMQGRYGSDDIQGQAVETATVYFAQGRKGIREFYWDGESSAFRTNNIALLADHILRESAVIDFDYMTNPYSRLIIVRENGSVASMLYDKTNGVMAWSRIIPGKGKVKNCAVTRGEDENDLVFYVVEDGGRYFLEVLDYGSEVYIDSWKEYEGSIDGYTEGAMLFNFTTKAMCPYDDIPEDFINLDDVVYIGYKYKSYIKSMPVIAGDPSKRIRISTILVRFLDSYLPVMKITNLPEEGFSTITEVPYSGIGKVTYPGVTDHDVCFEIEADLPQAVNILSVDAQTA